MKIEFKKHYLQVLKKRKKKIRPKMHPNTYLTEISFTGKSEDKRGSKNDVLPSASFEVEKRHRTKYIESVKTTQVHFRPINKAKQIVNFFNETYYENKRVKPGMNIYKAIIEGQEKRRKNSKIPPLEMNLKHTVFYCDNVYQMLYTEKSKVKMTSDVEYQTFLSIAREGKQYDIPAALQMNGAGVQIERSVVMLSQITPKCYPKQENQGITNYPEPYNNIPTLLRLFFYPRSLCPMFNSHHTYGYKLTNKKKIQPLNSTKKHHQLHHYVVQPERQGESEIVQMRGKALREASRMTQSLVNFLQEVKGVKIQEVVIDFLVDHEKTLWFYEIKSIKSHNLTRIWDVGSEEEIVKLTKEKNRHIRCRLCGFVFARQEVPNVVTNKLIYELAVHMKQRGQSLPFDISFNTSNLADTTMVCQLCFQLILAEHRLIDVEHEFCQWINIHSDNTSRVALTTSPPPPISNPSQDDVFNLFRGLGEQIENLTKVQILPQWRLFFYLERIRNIPIPFNTSSYTVVVKFKDFKEVYRRTFVKTWKYTFQTSRAKSALSGKRELKKHQSLMNGFIDGGNLLEKKVTFPTHHTNRTHENPNSPSSPSLPNTVVENISLNTIKILPFYSSAPNIQSVLHDSALSFEVQFQPSGNIFQGNSATLEKFTNKPNCQRHSCQILLFDEEYNHCSLELTVGLICDGKMKVNNCDLAGGEKGWYLSKGISGCKPLPEEWMQILNQNKPSAKT